MKILQFIRNKDLGGIEQCAIDYVECLTLGGHEVRTVIPKDKVFYEKNLKDMNAKVYRVDTDNKIKTIFALRKIVKEFRPDIYITHGGRGGVLMRMACPFKKFPTIGVNHGLNCKMYIKYRKADYSFCVNTKLANDTNELAKSLGKKLKAYYFPNMTKFDKGLKYKKKKYRKPVRIGILSRIAIGQKNLDKIAEAIKILKDDGLMVKFIVGGTGGQMEEFKQIIKDLKVEDRFEFLGWVTNKKKFFDDIDIFCMPSRCETFGISYIEAMKYSTPCIVSNNRGAVDIFTDKVDGLMVSKDNENTMAKEIADAIKNLASDNQFGNKIAKNGFERCWSTYSLEAGSKRFNRIFDEILLEFKK